jgi:uncharacterized protein (DUF433 family)
MPDMNWRNFITFEPGKRGGKPCIRGMRITVQDVMSYFAAGMSREEILHDFPYLTNDDLNACFAYVADREAHQVAVSLSDAKAA